jgi:hypothetical protein
MNGSKPRSSAASAKTTPAKAASKAADSKAAIRTIPTPVAKPATRNDGPATSSAAGTSDYDYDADRKQPTPALVAKPTIPQNESTNGLAGITPDYDYAADRKQATQPPTPATGSSKPTPDDAIEGDGGGNRKQPTQPPVPVAGQDVPTADEIEADNARVLFAKVGLNMIGPYRGQTIVVAAKCINGSVSCIKPISIQQNGYECKCKNCVDPAADGKQQFVADIKNRFPGATIKSEVDSADKKILCECARGHKCTPKAANVSSGQGLCDKCGREDAKESYRRGTNIRIRKCLRKSRLTMVSVFKDWKTKVDMRCDAHEHEFNRLPKWIFEQKSGPQCPDCVGHKKGERRFGRILRALAKHVQIEFEMLPQLPKRFYDFLVIDCFLEFDGDQHFRPMHNNAKKFDETRTNDLQKTLAAMENKKRMVRVHYYWLISGKLANQVAFLRTVLASSEKLLVTDAGKYDWLKKAGFTPVVPTVGEPTAADIAIAAEIEAAEKKDVNEENKAEDENVELSPTEIAAIQASASAGPTEVQCPEHGGDCFVNGEELERVVCKHGCIAHSKLAFKTTSNHPFHAEQRARMLERCRRCPVLANRKKAAAAPKRRRIKLPGTVSCPVHVDCFIPADWLFYKSCRQCDIECGSLVFNRYGPANGHAQSDQYNASVSTIRLRCDRNEKKRLALEGKTDGAKQSTLDANDSKPAAENSEASEVVPKPKKVGRPPKSAAATADSKTPNKAAAGSKRSTTAAAGSNKPAKRQNLVEIGYDALVAMLASRTDRPRIWISADTVIASVVPGNAPAENPKLTKPDDASEQPSKNPKRLATDAAASSNGPPKLIGFGLLRSQREKTAAEAEADRIAAGGGDADEAAAADAAAAAAGLNNSGDMPMPSVCYDAPPSTAGTDTDQKQQPAPSS